MKKARFHLTANGIRPKTTENSDTLCKWVEQIEGRSIAKDVQEWSKTCKDGDYYNGKSVEIIRIN